MRSHAPSSTKGVGVRSFSSVILCGLAVSACTAAAGPTLTASVRPTIPPAPPGIHRQLVATITVIHDKPHRVNFLTSLNADCTSLGETVVQIVQGPTNGKTNVVRTLDYTNYAPGNQRAECNKRKMPGTKVTYVPNPGFTGADQVVMDVIFPTGQAQRHRVNLVVR